MRGTARTAAALTTFCALAATGTGHPARDGSALVAGARTAAAIVAVVMQKGGRADAAIGAAPAVAAQTTRAAVAALASAQQRFLHDDGSADPSKLWTRGPLLAADCKKPELARATG